MKFRYLVDCVDEAARDRFVTAIVQSENMTGVTVFGDTVYPEPTIPSLIFFPPCRHEFNKVGSGIRWCAKCGSLEYESAISGQFNYVKTPEYFKVIDVSPDTPPITTGEG